jgi:shikimate kinase
MNRVYLVGFMGAGKSTVGRSLADRLGWQFVDLDESIVKRWGAPISRIFEQFGEKRFREMESEVLRDLPAAVRTVVALGGGTYASAENREWIDRTGVAVYLKVTLETVMARVHIDGNRPLFTSSEVIAGLYRERLPSYERAGVVVPTDGRTPDEIAAELVRALGNS